MSTIPSSTPTQQQVGYRAQLLYFNGRPSSALSAEEDPHVIHYADGLLIVADGKIVASGNYDDLINTLDNTATVHDWRGKLIMPGFIDTHIHYPQADIIASPAPDLLPWLETYTFPTEGKFHDAEHASEVSEFSLMNYSETAQPVPWSTVLRTKTRLMRFSMKAVNEIYA